MNAPLKYGVAPMEDVLRHDGLTFMRKMMAGDYPAPPIAETLGFTLSEVSEGRAVFESVPAFRHYNPIGAVHGGFAMTLLDSCVGCAVHTTMQPGEAYTTLEIKVNLVRGLTKDTGRILAEGKVLYRGRTTATAEGYLRDESGKLYAHATTTCMIFPVKR